jgi:hypothetical protein
LLRIVVVNKTCRISHFQDDRPFQLNPLVPTFRGIFSVYNRMCIHCSTTRDVNHYTYSYVKGVPAGKNWHFHMWKYNETAIVRRYIVSYYIDRCELWRFIREINSGIFTCENINYTNRMFSHFIVIISLTWRKLPLPRILQKQVNSEFSKISSFSWTRRICSYDIRNSHSKTLYCKLLYR